MFVRIFLSLFLTLSIYCKSIEFCSFNNLPQYIDQNTLLILDIDDTLLITKQMLGSDMWFCARLKELENQGNSAKSSLQKTLFEWEAIRRLSDMELVESICTSVIEDLQSQNIKLIGLTTQGYGLAQVTPIQLKKHRIDLTKTAITHQDHYFNLENQGVLFHQGILFTCGTDKGKALFLLLDKLNFLPEKIVFINDKQKHLNAVEKECQKRAIPFLGLRYSASDLKKENFNLKIANYQLNHSTLLHIISDQDSVSVK